MNQKTTPFTSVVLAGDRKSGDPVAKAAGVAGKALTPVGGKPMLLRVLDALDAAQAIDTQVLCGPPQPVLKDHAELGRRITTGRVQWMEPQATPSSSAYRVLQSLPGTTPILLTTADHALLTSEIVDYFCTKALEQGCDLAVALASYDLVAKAYPGVRRTATRLRDGAYCSCNLFGFLTPAAREAAAFWCRVEHERKRPWKIVSAFGWLPVLRYVMGQLSLSEGLARISSRMGLNVQAVMMPFPQAAVDVDTVEDWRFVESLIGRGTLPRASIYPIL